MSFKKLALISGLAVLLGVSIIYALYYDVQQRLNAVKMFPTAKAIDNSGELELTIQLERNMYSLDEPINITFTFANVCNHTVWYGLGFYTVDFLVYNDTNNSIFEWTNSGIGHAPHVSERFLEPHMNYTDSRIWPQTYVNTTMWAKSQVSAGTYYIVGIDGTDVGIGGADYLETTPIQITIVGS